MPQLDKFVITWSPLVGLVGNSVLYVTGGSAITSQPRLITMFQNIAPYIPSSITIQIPNQGETIDVATGKMINVWSGGTVSNTVGTGSTGHSAVSGALIRWDTGAFKNGRKVRGRTFIVPVSSSNYTSGVIATATANAIQGAGATWISTGAGAFQVYSRPVYDLSTDPPTLKVPGSSYTVTTATCPTKVTYLSSRRD